MHLCIGAVYSWSIFNPILIRELGVVSSAADDWNISSVVWVFSVAVLFLGLAAALAGRWLRVAGPRMVGACAACLWGGGFLVGSLGIYLHQLWVVFLGYGVLGGAGIGLGYVAPIANLIRWFPDRPGMAAGTALMGFGGGAILAVPLKELLIRLFYEAPQYLGPAEAVNLITEQGRRFANVAGQQIEVVVTSAADASGAAGVYVVGTGDTGATGAFIVLGIIYFTVMMIAAFAYRVPPRGWEPGEEAPQSDGPPAKEALPDDVHITQVHKTPQFYLLSITLCFNATAGIGIIGVAKTMMSDIFGATLPGIVTPAFAATYVLMISAFNLLGRFFWAYLSDYIGRRKTYFCLTGIGAALYLSIPFATSSVSVNPAVTWLIMFYAATMLALTMFGGGIASLPAYVADLYGRLHVGGIHGRVLAAVCASGLLGPFVVTYFRDRSIASSINDLASRVDPAEFALKFGAPIERLEELIAAKTVTIGKLMEIAPPGTIDPTPNLYNITMFVMAGLLAAAFIANMMIRPVDDRHRVKNTHPELA